VGFYSDQILPRATLIEAPGLELTVWWRHRKGQPSEISTHLCFKACNMTGQRPPKTGDRAEEPAMSASV
jgi:hypothetical protein